jgi:hypothetical protein
LTWSEKFLDKARRSGIKDILLGKLTIPKTNDEIYKKTDEGMAMMKIFEINKLSCTELILSTNLKTSSDKVDFNTVKGCKNNSCTQGNAAIGKEQM